MMPAKVPLKADQGRAVDNDPIQGIGLLGVDALLEEEKAPDPVVEPPLQSFVVNPQAEADKYLLHPF